MQFRRRWIVLGAAGIAVALACAFGWLRAPTPRATTPMSQSIYVWQRAWGDSVRCAVGDHAAAADGGLIALAAEVAWKAGMPSTAVVRLDYATLAAAKTPVGLALRIGPCPAKLLRDPDTIAMLATLARDTLASARAGGLEPHELQIDFDSATARLDDYRRWIEIIAAEVKPMPVTITVLPSWMSSSAFGPLVAASAGFVLQVHSVEKARIEADAPTLCDAASAVRWTEQASRYGVPFLVALPTYGYLAILGEDGALQSLIAEQGGATSGPGARAREVSADPAAMAQLVRQWSGSRPQAMRGIVWYRLPVDGDSLNWSWPTLARVMRAEEPRGRIALQVQEAGPQLFDVVACNEGDADAPLPARVRVEWGDAARLLGADALAGVSYARGTGNHAGFVRTASRQASRLRPGERRTLGWLRLDTHTEVTVHVEATE